MVEKVEYGGEDAQSGANADEHQGEPNALDSLFIRATIECRLYAAHPPSEYRINVAMPDAHLISASIAAFSAVGGSVNNPFARMPSKKTVPRYQEKRKLQPAY